MSNTSLEDVVSSEELLKQAWSAMGRTRKGDRVEDRHASASGVLTSSANASNASSVSRDMAAEDIARLLKAETDARRAPPATQRSSYPSVTKERPVAAPPRPRRTTHMELPPLVTAPPPPAPSRPPPERPSRQAPRPPASPQPEPQEGGRSRRNLGWLIFAGIWALSAIIGTFADGSSSSDETTGPAPTTVVSIDLTSTTLDLGLPPGVVTEANIRDLGPGACIATIPAGTTINTVPTVECSAPHEYEMFANVELMDLPDSYPGFDAVVDQAFELCSTDFEAYVGETYASSQWYIEVITPTETGWNTAGDRQVNCLLYLWDAEASLVTKLTGSAARSG